MTIDMKVRMAMFAAVAGSLLLMSIGLHLSPLGTIIAGGIGSDR